MHAEVIAIGDELASGQRLDTNSQWLSQRLNELGIPVLFHTTVADDVETLTGVFRQAVTRCDVVVASGGLGPTADDLTREALAAVAGTELALDESALRHIENLFQSRGRTMPERNRVQAMFPTGSRPIPNPHGTAPGIALQLAREGNRQCHLFALPGVPAEMREMWQQTVALELGQLTGTPRVILHRCIKCFGTGESQLEAMLPDLIRRGRDPSVGITVHAATITLRVTAKGVSTDECQQRMAPTLETIRECLGEMVFGEEEDELQHAVIRLLAQRGETLATAECGTSGRLGHWLSELPDAVGIYRGGLVAAADGSAAIVESGRQLAENGAVGCRQQFAADYGLAVGPIADEPGRTDAAAQFYFALADADGVRVLSSPTAGHPQILKDRAAKQALNLLRLKLLRQRATP